MTEATFLRLFGQSTIPSALIDVPTLCFLTCNAAMRQALEVKEVESVPVRTLLTIAEDDDTWASGNGVYIARRDQTEGGLPANGHKVLTRFMTVAPFPVSDDPCILVQFEESRELARSEGLLQRLIETIYDGYWDWYPQMDYEYMSPRFWQMLGYDHKEMRHHPSEWMKMIHPADLPATLRNFEQHVETRGKHPYDNEVRYFHRDGSIVWIKCRGNVIDFDDEGKPLRMVGTHTDITAIKERVSVLQRAQFAIENSRMKSSFMAHMSHELRTPLNGVIGFAEHCMDLLSKMTEGADDKVDDATVTINEYMRHITTCGNHLLTIVNDILTYSKLEAGKLELRRETIVLMDVLNASEAMSRQVDSKRLEWSITVADDVPAYIVADRLRLTQVLLNLLSNAVKFTPSGGKISIDVTVLPLGTSIMPPGSSDSTVVHYATADGSVEQTDDGDDDAAAGEGSVAVPRGMRSATSLVDTTAKNVLLRFQVQDTGIGISPEHLSRLFQPYTQAPSSDSNTTTNSTGTGLGLSIARALVQRMHGEMRVDSTVGKGSVFTFTLLVAEAPPESLPTAASELGLSEVLPMRSPSGPNVPSLRRTDDTSTGATAAAAATSSDSLMHLPASDDGRATILVVEDNPMNQKVFRVHLRRLGFRVVDVAEDGKAGLEKACQADSSYRLIFMDVMMPVMDGHEASREIKAWYSQQARLVTPMIIGVSANVLSEDANKGLSSGMDMYLTKPLTHPKLCSVLAPALPAI